MSKKQEKKINKNIVNNQENNINLDINNPNSYLYQYWFTNNIVDATVVVINKDTPDHAVDIDVLKEVIIDNTNDNTK